MRGDVTIPQSQYSTMHRYYLVRKFKRVLKTYRQVLAMRDRVSAVACNEIEVRNLTTRLEILTTTLTCLRDELARRNIEEPD